MLYHFFSTAYYARVNRTESSSSQKEFEDIVRSEGAIIISKRDRFPPDTEILRLNSKGWTFKEFKCSTEVYFFFTIHWRNAEENLHYFVRSFTHSIDALAVKE